MTLIETRRKQLNLSQAQVAKAVGVSTATISRWESGNIKNMGRDKIPALAKVLHISELDLLNEYRDNLEVNLSDSEVKLIVAYRKASPSLQEAINKLLDIPAQKEAELSNIG